MMLREDAILAVPVSAHDHAQGDARALVTLVEYGDFQCPACGMAYPVVKQIERRYAGNMRFVFRHFPLSQVHPYARMAAELAEAAGVQGQFWAAHDWLYENQDDWIVQGAAFLEVAVRALGLDAIAIGAALRNSDIDAHIRRDFEGGVHSGVSGTPGFFVNGRLYYGDFQSLGRSIAGIIARQV